MNDRPPPASEQELIELFCSVGPPPSATTIGIGDDCAVLDLGGPDQVVVTTDTLVEGSHFTRQTLPPWQLGWKSLAVNLSDVAAMGARPSAAFLSLGLPGQTPHAEVRALRDGMAACANAYGVPLLGGDTVRADLGWVLTLTVLGRAPADQLVTRAGGQPGDQIWLGGPVGDSAAGLALLQSPKTKLADHHRQRLLRAHQQPRPQLALGRWLATEGQARAMLDVSDGVLRDLGRLCQASAVGAAINADTLPVSAAAQALAGTLGTDALSWALGGGEDYVLLFCCPPHQATAIATQTASDSAPVCIGRLVAGTDRIRLERGGQPVELKAAGWDPFASDQC